MTYRTIAVAAGLLLMLPAIAQAEALRLDCPGVATVQDAQTTSVNVSGDVDLTANATRYGTKTVQERLVVEIDGTTARVHLPRSMIPLMNSGGADGWWTLAGFTASPTEYSGSFRLNLVNKPTVVVDRRTGAVDLRSRLLRFQGSCENVANAPTKF